LVIKSYTDENAYDKNSVRLIEMIAHELSSVLQRGKMIMDLIKAKEKAEESDKLKSAFLANISHEIRTPMNGILGFLELLSNHDITDDEREKFMEMVNKSSLRLMGTINDIVEISKIESGKIDINYVPVNLSEVMDYYKDLYWHKTQSKGIELVLGRCIRGELANISTDRFKLDGIITNLLNNAIKFTHTGQVEFGNYYLDLAGNEISTAGNNIPASGGNILAAGSNIPASGGNIQEDGSNIPASGGNILTAGNNFKSPAGKLGGSGCSVVFYVKDTGIGIPKDKQEAIFGRFIQASHEISNLYEGSGLGLSIVKAYIDALKGKIWVESELGKGSTFYVSIPV
jgi:signal transduction histidine kinase